MEIIWSIMTYSKKWRKAKIDAGLCGTCGKKSPVPEKVECSDCAERTRKRQKEAYWKNKEEGESKSDFIKKKRCLLKEAGMCARCGRNSPTEDRLTCDSCLERQRFLHQVVKDQVFAAYGGYKCNCCGETTKEFLMLDHVNNDGAAHRREIFGRSTGAGRVLYTWIKKNKFPPTFQVLCANCNWGKRINGICPHKAIQKESPVSN